MALLDFSLYSKNHNSSWFNSNDNIFHNNNKPTNILLNVNSTDLNNGNLTEFDATKKRLISILQEELSFVWIVFGTIGNILSLLVLLRRKMRIHSTFTYLTILSLCDTFVLYFGLLRDFLVNKYKIDIDGDLLCKFHVFSFYFVLHMASWLLVAVNVDRLIAASFLSFSKKWCTPRTAIKVSIWITISLALLNSHFIYYVDSSSSKRNAITSISTTSPSNKKSSLIIPTSTHSFHHIINSQSFDESTHNLFSHCLTIKNPNNLNNITNNLLVDCLFQASSNIKNNTFNKINLKNIQSFLLLNKINITYLNAYLVKYNAILNQYSTKTSTSYIYQTIFSKSGNYEDETEVNHENEVEMDQVNPYVYQKCLIKANNPKYSYFFQNIFTWLDTSMQVIVPFVIMVICNFNIIYKVLLTKRKTNGKNLKRLRKIKGMCIMIVSVSVIFFVLEAPILIFICLIQGQWISQNWPHMDMAWTILNLMMYTNHVINFLSYCMTGTKFRRELIKLLCFDKILKFSTNGFIDVAGSVIKPNGRNNVNNKSILQKSPNEPCYYNNNKNKRNKSINVCNNNSTYLNNQDEIIKLNEHSHICIDDDAIINNKINHDNHHPIKLINVNKNVDKTPRLNFSVSYLKNKFEKRYNEKTGGLFNSKKLNNDENFNSKGMKPISLTRKIIEKKRELNERSISLQEMYSNNDLSVNFDPSEHNDRYLTKTNDSLNKNIQNQQEISFCLIKDSQNFLKNWKNVELKKLKFLNKRSSASTPTASSPTKKSKNFVIISLNDNNNANQKIDGLDNINKIDH